MTLPADPDAEAAAGFASLGDLLHYRTAVQPCDRAYVVLSERGQEEAAITFAGLASRAAGLALRIRARAAPGERALLLCPTGVDFIVGLFGCILAGVIAVPLMLPRRQSGRDASGAILGDCTPRLALSLRRLVDGERGDLAARFADRGLTWLAIDEPGEEEAAPPPLTPATADIALLQYTSGSTSAPKGAMVSHANLLANLAMIKAAFGSMRRSTTVSWVPLYHDLGLVINALQTLYSGSLCVLIPPAAFIQRPLLWLKAIGDYRAEIAVSPNFGFDLCVERYRPEQMAGVDLSGWRLALNGAEPVQAATLRRFAHTFAPHGFAADAFYPAYGMAEATVLIAAGRRGAGAVLRPLSRAGLQRHRVEPPADAGDSQVAVGVGRALRGERIAIVDPESRERLAVDEVGEIWVAGANVSRGYWRNPAATAEAFRAEMTGEPGGEWLRTGDLGFLDKDGELFITGRIKEVVILRGANHYPQDIEETVQRCHPALRRHGGAAFEVGGGDGAERLVIVQEVERTERHRVVADEIIGHIREAVVGRHDIVPHAIVLLRPGALPKTTSGKIQRMRARDLWLAGALARL